MTHVLPPSPTDDGPRGDAAEPAAQPGRADLSDPDGSAAAVEPGDSEPPDRSGRMLILVLLAMVALLASSFGIALSRRGSVAVPSAAPAGAGSPGNAATIDFSATPAADWKPFDPTLAPAEGGTLPPAPARGTPGN